MFRLNGLVYGRLFLQTGSLLRGCSYNGFVIARLLLQYGFVYVRLFLQYGLVYGRLFLQYGLVYGRLFLQTGSLLRGCFDKMGSPYAVVWTKWTK